jgi:hypothetical protein
MCYVYVSLGIGLYPNQPTSMRTLFPNCKQCRRSGVAEFPVSFLQILAFLLKVFAGLWVGNTLQPLEVIIDFFDLRARLLIQ